MPDYPDISVVLGAYNAGAELGTTLESVLREPDIKLEAVVVDDGSTDQTAERLARMARADGRIKVLRQAHAGLTSALIRGCREARGRYIARQDIGDRSLPGRLRWQAALLDTNPEAVMVTCGCRFMGPGGEVLDEIVPRHTPAEWTGILRSGDEARLYGPHHGSVMFRKAAYDAVGGYRPEFYFAQDLDLWTRLAAVGTLDYVPEVYYQAGFSYGSLSARFDAQQRQLKEIIAQAARRRASGEPEDDLLVRAAAIGKPAGGAGPPLSSLIGNDYFIGTRLVARRDPAARHYLKRVLRKRPFHAKAWAKLLWSYLAPASAAQ